MSIPTVDRALLDTNILLAATDVARQEHEQAMAVINDWPLSGVVLYTSGQILREYLAVATRPAQHNGLGMTRPDAVENVRTLRDRLNLLVEDAKVSDRLLLLLEAIDCSGKRVHDANVVATMLVHGVHAVVTLNIDDFARFADHVRVTGPIG